MEDFLTAEKVRKIQKETYIKRIYEENKIIIEQIFENINDIIKTDTYNRTDIRIAVSSMDDIRKFQDIKIFFEYLGYKVLSDIDTWKESYHQSSFSNIIETFYIEW